MGTERLSDQLCPVARAIAVVGDTWTLMMLREFFLGARRFEDIRVQTGMSPQLLSGRLKSLVAAGVLRRVPYSERPIRYEFRLTDMGRGLWPVIIALKQWGDQHLTPDQAKPLIRLVHKDCRHDVEPALACPHCGQAATATRVTAEMSPAMTADRSRRGRANSQVVARARRRLSAAGP